MILQSSFGENFSVFTYYQMKHVSLFTVADASIHQAKSLNVMVVAFIYVREWQSCP